MNTLLFLILCDMNDTQLVNAHESHLKIIKEYGLNLSKVIIISKIFFIS